ncbi:MAG: SurA N-terminal domain-containing protein, partial [Cytophagales bacterium]
MALIGKLREKSGWAIGIIAAGLGLFIVGGDILSPSSVIRGNNKNTVGEIAGEEISTAKFQQEIDEMRYVYYLNNNKAPGEAEMTQFLPQAWNQMIFKVAYQKEFDALGLEVGKEEVIDMVQGRNIHPAIYQSFTNPQTRQFDRNYVIQYLQNISKMEAKQQAAWSNFEKNLGPDRLRNKYEALLKKTSYVTKAEAKKAYFAQTSKVDVKFVYIPFTTIADGEAPVSESDIEDYISKNKTRFSTEPSVNFQYVTFSITPSQFDTTNYKTELNEITEDFKKSDDDSMFVALNADNPTIPRWMNPGELPEQLQKLATLEKNTVYGPYTDGAVSSIFKVADVKADTAFAAKASHILFRWDSESDEDKAKALDKAKEVLAKINKGESFEDMSRQFGTDGSAAQGGDLGWFGQGRMVKGFQDAVFAASKKGLIPQPVKTDFGYHLIKVTETKTNKKFYVCSVDKAIVPGDETRDSVYKLAETFALNSQDLNGFNLETQKNPLLQKVFAPNVLSSSPYVNNLSKPKELIRWAFNDAKEENISPVFEIDNQYVVAALINKYDEGTPNLESNKQMIAYTISNEKKGDKIIEKIGVENTNIDDIAAKAGSGAIVNTATDINLASAILAQGSFEPQGVGAAFGLAEGKTTKAIKGLSGVVVIQTLKKNLAADVADYGFYKNQLLASSSRNEYSIAEA